MRLITFLCELRISGQRNSRELTNETPLKNENICNGYHCGIMAFLKFFTLRLRAGPRFFLEGENNWEMTSTSFQVLFVCFLFCFVFCFCFLVFFFFFFFFFAECYLLERLRSSQGRGRNCCTPPLDPPLQLWRQEPTNSIRSEERGSLKILWRARIAPERGSVVWHPERRLQRGLVCVTVVNLQRKSVCFLSCFTVIFW